MKKKRVIVILLIIIAVFLALFLLICALGDDDTETTKNEYNRKITEASSIRKTNAVRDIVTHTKGNGEDTVTMLIYMNGSNLETDDGEATTDLTEIIKAGSSDKVNVIVQTMGTKQWQKFGIASDHAQRYLVNGDGLTLIDDSLSQLDCTKASTLSDFIKWGKDNYPADRYILHFWNHGAGPVYGFGYDEWNKTENASLTVAEIKEALSDAGVFFDCISMDCCIMATIETCCALYDYCDYMILSEEFESGLGWSYTGFMKALYKNSSISIPDMAKIAIDDMIAANEADPEWGDKSILSLIDESMMKVVFTAWRDFAYANEAELTNTNYSQKLKRIGRGAYFSQDVRNGSGRYYLNDKRDGSGRYSGFDFFSDEEEYKLSDYYVTDLMGVAANIDSDLSDALESAIDNAIIYSKSTAEDAALTGLAVTLPYGDRNFYQEMESVFDDCGIDQEYTDFLESFVNSEGVENFYDYDDWYEDDWNGWGDYESEFNWDDWDYYDNDEYWDDEDYWSFDDWDYSGWCDEDYSEEDYDYDYDYFYDDDYYYSDYYEDDYDGYYGGDYSEDGYDGYYGGDYSEDGYYYEDEDESFFDIFGGGWFW